MYAKKQKRVSDNSQKYVRVSPLLRNVLLCSVLFAGICWSIYYCVNNFNSSEINDPVVRAAEDWLRKADRFKFEQCKSEIIDNIGWFDYFKKDRTSIGDMRKRNFKIKSERPPGSNQFNLFFDTQFEKIKLTENVELTKDSKGKFTINRVRYNTNSNFFWKWDIYEGRDVEQIKKIAAECTNAMDYQDMAYFESIAREAGHQSIYEYVNSLRRHQQRHGKPVKRDFMELYYKKDIPGMAPFEYLSLVNRTTYMIKNERAFAYERIIMRKDNLNENKDWVVQHYSPGNPRVPKPADKKNNKNDKKNDNKNSNKAPDNSKALPQPGPTVKVDPVSKTPLTDKPSSTINK
jgi:hypothetical protein